MTPRATRRESRSLALLLAVLALGCSREAAPPRPTLRVALYSGEEGKPLGDLVRRYPGATISVETRDYDDLRDRVLQVVRSGGRNYDLVMLDDPWVPQVAPFLARLDGVPQELLDDLVPASLALGRDPYATGELKALPYVGNCQLLFYRRDLLASVGAEEPPGTWADVLDVAGRIESAHPGVSGYCVRGRSGAFIVSDFLPVLWAYGGRVLGGDGNAEGVTIESDATLEAFRTYRRLAELSPAGAESFDVPEMIRSFVDGGSALQLNWPAAIAAIDEALPRDEAGERVWGVALPPGGPGRPGGTSMIGNWLLGVPASSASPTAARALLVWLLEHQAEASGRGNPPTRRSLFASLGSDPRYFHFGVVEQALDHSTPRPRTPKWQGLEDELSASLSDVIRGQQAPEDELPLLRLRLEAVVGYTGHGR